MHKTVVATSEKTYFVGVRVAPAAFAGAKTRDAMAKSEEPITIKKYANRRLYNTGTSTYVTLEDLAGMVKQGDDFVVYDAKTGEDITRSVLAQIIFEQENKEGQNLLPINFLRQLIRFYGDCMQMLVPRYLEVSLEFADARAGEIPPADGAGLRRQRFRPAGRAGAPEHGDVRKGVRDVRAVCAAWRPGPRPGGERGLVQSHRRNETSAR